jgi:hypothetical protein
MKMSDLEFMKNPSQWPGADSESYTICLKRYLPKEELAVLTYVNGVYTFTPNREIKTGGQELLVELVTSGWMVD